MDNQPMSSEELAALDKMSVDELVAKQQSYNHERALFKKKALDVQAVLERKVGEMEALRKYEKMSDSERKALAHLLSPNGIKGEEAVGKPGR